MLYHVSLDPIDKFKLQVPNVLYKEENNTIKRICFSKSLVGAISAMPYSVNILSGLLNLYKELGILPILYIYTIDEKNLDEKDIIDSNILYEENLVQDAHLTEEVWVLTESIKPKCRVIKIGDFYFNTRKMKNNKAIYVVDKLIYKEASETEVKITEEIWNKLKSEYKKFNNKEFDNIFKRDFIGTMMSSFSSKKQTI